MVAALKYLDYLEEYWLSPDLWRSWSLAGRLRAAKVLGVPVEGVLPTTNHLESFNRVLKRGHIRQSEKGGRRLRFDVFFHYLISSIIPSIFDSRRHAQEHISWVDTRFNGHRFEPVSRMLPRAGGSAAAPPIAWIPPSVSPSTRQLERADIARLNRLLNIRYIDDKATVEALCLSSKWVAADPNPVTYTVRIWVDGFGECSCPDFRHRSATSGACKHLFALLDRISAWRSYHPEYNLPLYSLPTEPSLATKIRSFHLPSATDASPSTLQEAAIQLADVLEIPSTGWTEVRQGLDPDAEGALSAASSDADEAIEKTVVTEAVSRFGLLHEWLDSDVRASHFSPKTSQIRLPCNGNDHQALREQLHVQLNHATRCVLPQLYHIELLLTDIEVTETGDIAKLRTLLARLTIALEDGAARQGDRPTASQPLVKENIVSIGQTTATRVQISEVRPPSPEKRQVRKQSYGVL